jgi:acylphosphatase
MRERPVCSGCTDRIHMPTSARLFAIVHGRVQGVFFRDFTRRQALALRLVGYVRNLRDGTVELAAEGPRSDLEELLGRIGVGPPGAWVERVDSEWQDPNGDFDSFEVRY